MTVFLMVVFYGLLKRLSLPYLMPIKAGPCSGENYDRLPHIYRSQWRYQRRFILKKSTTHQNRLSRFFQQHPQPMQPAQTAPGGEHHSGLAGFPLTDGALVHI